jgi:glutamate/aspartate transport system substrate-binding protein
MPLPRLLRRALTGASALACLFASALAALAAPAASSASGPPTMPPASGVLRKISDTGLIVVGHRIASVPFSYLDAKLRPVGYSMDLCHRVVDAVRQRLGLADLEVKLVAVTSATRMPLVANGTVDLECGVTTNTAERQKSQAFSVTTFVAASRLLAKKENEVRSLDDLRGKPVASTIATTSFHYLNGVNESRRLDMRIVAGQDDTDAFLMVQTDRAVAFAMDDVLLKSLLASAPNPGDYSISDETLSVEPYGIGLPRDDAGFKHLVDGVLVDLFRSGEIHAIYRKWFQMPIPPRGINLQLPMSEALKRAIAQPTDSPDPAVYR